MLLSRSSQPTTNHRASNINNHFSVKNLEAFLRERKHFQRDLYKMHAQTYLIMTLALVPALLLHAAPQGYGYAPQFDLGPAGSNNIGSISSGGGGGGNKYLPPAATPQPALVRKQFYTISAPEDHDSLSKTKNLVFGRPQKNYRVVFIKAPAGENSNVKYSAEFAPQEEKTVIYVLNKKDPELNANDIATPPPTQPSKPEVFFIKYKTDDEAQAAQSEIQEQYDQLGGTNEYSNEGTAPIASVVGSLDGQTPDGGYDYRKIQGEASNNSPLSQYLPSVKTN